MKIYLGASSILYTLNLYILNLYILNMYILNMYSVYRLPHSCKSEGGTRRCESCVQVSNACWLAAYRLSML